MKATVRNDNNQNQNQLGDWFWFKPHRKERPYLFALPSWTLEVYLNLWHLKRIYFIDFFV